MHIRLPPWALPLSGGVLLVLAFAAHVAHYHPFFADDAFISLRYAHRFLAGEGLTWTAGEAVEGYSNLLWILLVSGLGSLGVDLVTAARALGVLCGGACLVLVWRGRTAGWISALALALCGPLAVWSIGGLEQGLVAALLATAFMLAERRPAVDPLWVGLPLGALCLTRPDGPLHVAVFALVCLVRQRAWRPALRLVALPIGAVAGQLVFRQLYYGEWLPNTAHMKAAWSADRLFDGLAWVGDGLWTLLPVLSLAGLAVLAAIIDPARRSRVGRAWAVALIWTGYVASVGGDIFPAHRHLVPTLVALAFAATEGVDWALRVSADRRPLAVALLGLVVAMVPLQQSADANTRALAERWEWDAVPVATVLRGAFADRDPLLAVTAAGALPYFARMRCLDMLGLNDHHIARQPAAPGGYIGHDHADGGYVLDRAPDLMVWGTPTGGAPCHRAGTEVRADPRFAAEYRRVRLEGFVPQPQTVVTYVRLRGRLGIDQRPDRIEVPAWLIGGMAKGVLVAPGELVARLPANLGAKSAPLTLPPGRWRVTTDPPEGAFGLVVSSPRPLGMARGVVEGPAEVRLHLRTGTLPADVRSVIFERVDTPIARRGRSIEISARPPSTRPSTPDQVLHAFDTADPTGWTIDGLRIALTPVPGQAEIQGRSKGVLNSFLPGRGDRAVGIARSPTFVVEPRTALRLRVAGGKSNVGVRLKAGAQIIAQWAGRDDEVLRTQTLDLSAYVGRALHLEVFDAARGRWGHVIVDDVQLVRWQPTQSVSKRMP